MVWRKSIPPCFLTHTQVQKCFPSVSLTSGMWVISLKSHLKMRQVRSLLGLIQHCQLCMAPHTQTMAECASVHCRSYKTKRCSPFLLLFKLNYSLFSEQLCGWDIMQMMQEFLPFVAFLLCGSKYLKQRGERGISQFFQSAKLLEARSVSNTMKVRKMQLSSKHREGSASFCWSRVVF